MRGKELLEENVKGTGCHFSTQPKVSSKAVCQSRTQNKDCSSGKLKARTDNKSLYISDFNRKLDDSWTK